MRSWILSICCVLGLQACNWGTWNLKGYGEDAGLTADAGQESCSMSHGVCFSAPELDTVSWGITAVSLGTPATTGMTQPLFVTAYSASEVVQLQKENSGFAELSRLSTDNPPWMAISGDYNQDGIVDCLIASPGSASQSGALSLWRYPGSGSWSKVISQAVGLGTYAVAARGDAAAGEVFAVAASYPQQVITLNLQPTEYVVSRVCKIFKFQYR